MRVHVLGSGSRGNAVLLEGGRERVLVDAGFGPRTLAGRLRAVDVEPRSITALVVTHEHGDHIGGAAAAAARWNWTVYGTPGTLGSLTRMRHRIRCVETRREIDLSDFSIRVIPTPHDAEESIALVATARSSGARVGIAYDLGYASPRLAKHFADLDLLLVEANHDEEMLWTGSYPTTVKRRIASRYGHLSNEAAGMIARGCVHPGLRHVVLCHLSEHNNNPSVALATVGRELRRAGYRGTLRVAHQDAILTVELGPPRRPVQLVLEL